MKTFKAGLFGLGTVGSAVFKALSENTNFGITIKKVAVRNINKNRQLSIDPYILTNDHHELLEDKEINLIIELINDPEEAFTIVKRSFQNGKSVVSANKKMVAKYLKELLALSEKYNVKFFYEAAVCGSIPILRLLEQHFKTDTIQSVHTIANGTCNFILSKMLNERQKFEEALKEAQNLGFAEADPYSDVSGEDTKFKLCIMIYHAFGIFTDPDHIPMIGIDRLDDNAIKFALSHGLRIKLVGKAVRKGDNIEARVLPEFFKPDHDFYHIEKEYNGIIVESKYAGQQFFKGKGAGSAPTATAVLSNLKDVLYKLSVNKPPATTNLNYSSGTATSYYYVEGSLKNIKRASVLIIEVHEDYAIIQSNFEEIINLEESSLITSAVEISLPIFQEITNPAALV